MGGVGVLTGAAPGKSASIVLGHTSRVDTQVDRVLQVGG